MNLFIRYTALLLCLATAPALAFEDKYLDANGVKLRYIDTGWGKAIVLLHGGWIEPRKLDLTRRGRQSGQGLPRIETEAASGR